MSKIKILCFMLCFLVACLLNRNVTVENYNKLKKRMTAAQIEQILGEPDSTNESFTQGVGTMEIRMYQLGTKYISVTTLNGKLYSKSKGGF